MKKNYSLLVLLFIGSFFANAQPVLNATDFEPELSVIIYTAITSGLSPGNAGANQNWDFSELTLTSNQTFSTVAVATAPLSNNFPASNYCINHIYNYGTNNILNVYNFYSLSNTSFKRIGYTENGVVISNNNTDIQFQFPYTYNTVINNGSTMSPITTVYDAYGTLKTPFGTYTNVIRQKETGNSANTFINYTWYQTNPYSPLLFAQFKNDGGVNLLVYKNTTGLGVNPIEPKKAMAIFPNPAHTELNIHLPDQQILDRVAISDVTGKIVLKQDQNLNQINVSHLANGLYFIEAHSGKEKYVTKFIKN